MEHQEFCDIKTVATQYGTLRGLRYEKRNLIATWYGPRGCDIKKIISSEPSMEHQEFCDIKTVISSQPDMKHQEGCGIKSVISSHPDMEHLDGCDIKNVISLQSDKEH
ncbi:hypothetical protein TNIN_76371 [Trichonephila inaurata madagascariensis]|uniref:Uncharacterized protein n=1 Tax=Trichonephila inaurata madagascariensis TaxID=2747483 RepID=A0A8X7C935_9ARAC|nr:hypothetical protein TNIN_76371 [Trichonephila inaurata madagascariensis]